MFGGDRQRRIVCVVGYDEDSALALRRVSAWQAAWPCTVRAIFLVSDELPAPRTPDASWFQAWSAREAGLELDARDVLVCRSSELPRMFERGAGMLTGLVVCPAPSDSASEIASISLRRMWSRAARLSAPLLVARRAITPRRVLVVTDGTARTLPVLRLAFELGEHMDASLGYLDAMRIPLLRSSQLAGPRPPQRVHASLASAASSALGDGSTVAYAHAAYGLAAIMAKASARERADLLVVGVAADDQDTVEKVIETAPCSVLAVPCGPER